MEVSKVFKAKSGLPWASSQSSGETVERRFALCGVGLDPFGCAIIELCGFAAASIRFILDYKTPHIARRASVPRPVKRTLYINGFAAESTIQN